MPVQHFLLVQRKEINEHERCIWLTNRTIIFNANLHAINIISVLWSLMYVDELLNRLINVNYVTHFRFIQCVCSAHHYTM